MEKSTSPKFRREQADIIQKIYDALPAKKFDTVNNIAKKAGVDRETCLRNLEIMDLVLGLQPGRYLEIIKVGDRVTAYRRKPKRKEREGS